MPPTAATIPPTAVAARAARKDFGDFQTPRPLVDAVLARLRVGEGGYGRILEPTCGRGHFLAGVLERVGPEVEVCGVEIQPEHAEVATAVVGDRGRVLRADLFRLDLGRDLGWRSGGRLLVVGNPPWVTAAALGASGGVAANPGPDRANRAGAPGLAALTGAANFDLAEAVALQVIRQLAGERPTVALLCKASVARGLVRAAHRDGLPIISASFRRVDAARWFGAAVGAGLFRFEVGPGPPVAAVPVYPGLESDAPEATWGMIRGAPVGDLDAYRRGACADGAGPIAWRQGVKHDAAAVLELTPTPGGAWANGLGERVDVEADRIYPWFKATDLARGLAPEPRRAVVLPQRALADDPAGLARAAPRLWSYLQGHAAHFARRKSSIYRNRPPFAIFGVGPYTFSPFKVAISGLHKAFRFRAVGPVGGRPPLVDDTGYFLPAPTAEAACTLAAALNGPEAADLLAGLTFADAKRPITQAVLRRLDLRALIARADRRALRERAEAGWLGLAAPAGAGPGSWPLVWQDGWASPIPSTDRP